MHDKKWRVQDLSRDKFEHTDYLGPSQPSQQGENCFLNQPVLYKPCEQGNAIVRCFGNWGHEYPLAEDKKYVAAEVAFKFMMDHPKINS